MCVAESVDVLGRAGVRRLLVVKGRGAGAIVDGLDDILMFCREEG